MSYSYYEPQGYYRDPLESLVLQKLMTGMLLASGIMLFFAFFPMPLIFYFIAFPIEFIAIIGYYFARQESTIETLYYVFVGSSAVILGYFLSFVLAVPGGDTMVLNATATTTLVVGGVYYYTSRNRPDVSNIGRYLLPATLLLFVVLIIGLFVTFGNTFNMLISLLGAGLFSLYLYYDLGRLMSGQVGSPARMAWQIYWDILLIFKFILRLLIYSQRR